MNVPAILIRPKPAEIPPGTDAADRELMVSQRLRDYHWVVDQVLRRQWADTVQISQFDVESLIHGQQFCERARQKVAAAMANFSGREI